MKQIIGLKTLILLILMFLGLSSYSQPKNIKVLLGNSEKYVRYYVDSLYKLKPSLYQKIEPLTTNSGDLLLTTRFNIDDENFYKVLYMIFKFKRVDGMEICTYQNITCSQEYSYENFVSVKDTYQYRSLGIWEKKLTGSSGLKIQATFHTKEDGLFTLEYSLKGE